MVGSRTATPIGDVLAVTRGTHLTPEPNARHVTSNGRIHSVRVAANRQSMNCGTQVVRNKRSLLAPIILSYGSGNKLLKIIEEPPPNTIFILVAENEKAILSTILSRCQLIRVPGLNAISIETALIQRNKLISEQAKDIAHICNGNYREALLLGQHANEDYYNLLKEWLNSILKNHTISQVKHIEEISRLGRENQKQFLKYFIYLIEQAVRLQLMHKNDQLEFLKQMSSSEREFVPKLNKVMNLDKLEHITVELDKASYYIERNANAKILFHALSIKIFHIVKNNVVIQD